MNEKFKKYLPIGSVVLMKDAKKKVMITGYAVKSSSFGEKIFDYIGCLYPEGYLGEEYCYVFNNEDIDQVIYKGYSDLEDEVFTKTLKEINDLEDA